MKALKKRGVAFLITVIVIALSTVFSVHRTLGAECLAVSDGFYEGVYNESGGYRNRSVQSQLERRYQTANGLYTVASKYDELADESAALRDAKNALYDATDISEKHSANQTLQDAFTAVAAAMATVELAETEQKAVNEYASDFKGAQSLIDRSGYNESVREFERSTLGVFPTNILKSVAFVSTPELFE